MLDGDHDNAIGLDPIVDDVLESPYRTGSDTPMQNSVQLRIVSNASDLVTHFV
jgi:hypothetical protein